MNKEEKVMEILKELNPILEEVGKKYAEEIVNCKIESEFKINEDTEIGWCKNYKNKPGIYYFEIRFNSIDEPIDKSKMGEYLDKEWSVSERGATPRIINERVEKHNIKNGEWIPFYIGKSKKLDDRIGQHIKFLRATEKTSALRLNEITCGIFKDADYRVRLVELEKYSGDRYWVVERIESVIRNEINPICGKQ